MTVHHWADAKVQPPEAFADTYCRTLNRLEEKPKVKKAVSRTVLLAAAIAVLLAGTAYAIVRTTLQDTYNTKILTAAQEYIQTNFPTVSYENYWYSVHVSEALSDGVTARVLLEYRAKDENTLLLTETEDDDLAFTIDGVTQTVAAWRSESAHTVRVGLPCFTVNGTEIDESYGDDTHVSKSVLRIWEEFDVPADREITISCREGYSADDGEWQSKADAWSFTLTNTMDAVQTVEFAELRQGDVQVRNLKLTFSPIYTYADYEIRAVSDQSGATYGNAETFLNTDGSEMNVSSGSTGLPDADGWQTVHARMDAMEGIPRVLYLRYRSESMTEIIKINVR